MNKEILHYISVNSYHVSTNEIFFILAASYNSLRVLRYLLNEEHADLHNQTYDGFLPIHYASLHGHDQSVELILSKSPDTVNEQTNQLLTSLHLACQCGSLETIQTLISHGANVNLKDQNGCNCLHIGKKKFFRERERFSHLENLACQYSHLSIVQWLIEKQEMNVNDIDYENGTSIHHGAASGSADLIYYLLENNAKILSDNHGNSPLHVVSIFFSQ